MTGEADTEALDLDEVMNERRQQHRRKRKETGKGKGAAHKSQIQPSITTLPMKLLQLKLKNNILQRPS